MSKLHFTGIIIKGLLITPLLTNVYVTHFNLRNSSLHFNMINNPKRTAVYFEPGRVFRLARQNCAQEAQYFHLKNCLLQIAEDMLIFPDIKSKQTINCALLNNSNRKHYQTKPIDHQIAYCSNKH